VDRPRTLDREILRLAVPALGALAAEPLYVLVDTAVVGHLGTTELAGLAVAGTILTTGFVLFNFLAYGTTGSVARAVGAHDGRRAAHLAVQGLWLASVIGVGLTVAGWVTAGALVDLFGVTGAVREAALSYLRISLLGAPAVLVALVGVGYLRGLQDIRTTLAVAIGSNVVNLVVELVLIYGLGIGIVGSAWATVLAQAGAAGVYLGIIGRTVRRQGVGLGPDPRRLRALVQVSSRLLVRTGSLLLALAVATGVASRMGPASLAAHQIAFQVWSFLALVLDALAIAGQAMTGRLLGAGDAAGARTAGRRMVRWGLAAGCAFAVVLALSRPALVPLFTPDRRVADLALDLLLVVAALQPLNAVVFVLDGVLIGAGDLRYLAAAMALSALAVFLPAALLVLRLELGLTALWGAIALLMGARLAGNTARFSDQGWQVLGAERQ
jgi:putative MATE family efflux protein